jgi:hypothetical protein
VEERGIFLSKLHIDQLGLVKVGERDTRNYGIVNVFSGVKIRIAADKCKSFVYDIPDGYVYETPYIYCSASMVATNHFGIPERQGIVNRELFYNHGIMSSGGVLYALPHDLFQISEIPNFMSKHPVCEIPVSRAAHGSDQWTYLDMNSALRRMHDVKGTDDLHPSLADDFFDVNEAVLRLLRPLPIEYMSAPPRCSFCGKKTALTSGSRRGVLAAVGKASSSAVLPTDLFYCPLCRIRHVQSPQVYCSKKCQASHSLSACLPILSHPLTLPLTLTSSHVMLLFARDGIM